MYCSNSLRFTNFLLPTKSTNGQFGERSILSILLIPIFFADWGGSPQKTFQFTTDIFSEKNRGLLKNKNAPGLGKSGSIVICGYEISENSKHSRCPYTAAK